MERSAFADVSAYQLKSPGNFSGPKSKIQIEIYSPFCFVTDSLTMLSAKLLKPLSWMQTTIALWAPHVNSPRSICWNSNLTPRVWGKMAIFYCSIVSQFLGETWAQRNWTKPNIEEWPESLGMPNVGCYRDFRDWKGPQEGKYASFHLERKRPKENNSVLSSDHTNVMNTSICSWKSGEIFNTEW